MQKTDNQNDTTKELSMDNAIVFNDSGNVSIYGTSGNKIFSRDLDRASRLLAIKRLAKSLEVSDGVGIWIPGHGYHK